MSVSWTLVDSTEGGGSGPALRRSVVGVVVVVVPVDTPTVGSRGLRTLVVLRRAPIRQRSLGPLPTYGPGPGSGVRGTGGKYGVLMDRTEEWKVTWEVEVDLGKGVVPSKWVCTNKFRVRFLRSPFRSPARRVVPSGV